MLARLYLRASGLDQDALRAKDALEAFAAERGLTVAATYVENESGASLQRPELFRLLNDAQPGSVILCEQVDRLSRLTEADWKKLRAMLAEKEVRVVALDLPTSYVAASLGGDEFTERMLSAINSLMLDLLAAIARKDYTDRRRRQEEGIARAKVNGAYRGRPADVRRHEVIATMLAKDISWSQIQIATGCSRATISKIKRLRAADHSLNAIS